MRENDVPYRDTELGAALRALDVPEHRPGFYAELHSLLARERTGRLSDARGRRTAARVANALGPARRARGRSRCARFPRLRPPPLGERAGAEHRRRGERHGRGDPGAGAAGARERLAA